jgi:APA family basic amino acid/polyamine antiporter
MAVIGNESSDFPQGATPAEDGAQSAPDGLFARKSSGLVRELGVRDALSINLGSLAPTGIGFFFFAVLAGFPGTDLTWPLIIGFVGVVLLSLMYSQLIAAMPRSGADYVYTSRILHPILGSAVGLAFFFAILIGSGAVAVDVLANTYLPFVFQTLGNVFHSHGLTTFAVTLTEKGWTIGVSLVICLITAWFMLQRVAIMAKAIYYAVGISIAGLVILILEFLFHSPGAFRHAYDHHLANPRAYQQLITAARHAGLKTGVSIGAVFASVALVNFVYGGATISNYTGGELRKPSTTYRSAALACCGVAFVLVLLAWLAMRHELGLPFTQSAAYLSATDPAAYGKLAGDVTAFVPSYVLLIASNPVSKVIIALGFAVGELAFVLVTGMVMSRLLFAMSFDRLLPSAIADVRPKSHVPMKATVLLVTLLFIFTLLVVYTSILSAVRNFGLIVSAVWAIVSFAAAIMPWRRPDLYERSPKVLGGRLLGLPALTVVAGLSCVYWMFATYLAATKTQVSGGYSTTSIIYLVVACGAGVVAYGVSRVGLRRKGLDLTLAMHELPPE